MLLVKLSLFWVCSPLSTLSNDTKNIYSTCVITAGPVQVNICANIIKYIFIVYIHYWITTKASHSACILLTFEGLRARSRAPSQYPKRSLSVRSRKISKPRDLYLELSDRSEIWQALRQQCCRCACQISKRYDNWKYQSRGFETLRGLKGRDR